MITITQGNLLDSKADALVNTVNTVGVMGKGIALMFKEAFPANFKAYEAACKQNSVQVGKMFVTESLELIGPKWIINFPTKQHWRHPSRLEWVKAGLVDLKKVIEERNIQSIALPPLGSGNGGLEWERVKQEIIREFACMKDVRIEVFEPTPKYLNVAKKHGVQELTPSRAMIAELIRRYLVLGIDCSLLEVQKLAWFLERNVIRFGLPNELDLQCEANRYGPYSHRLTKLLDRMDGSYLTCDKRISDASHSDAVWFNESARSKVLAYLNSDAKEYVPALSATDTLIDGFQSPLGLEALSTLDWLHFRRAIPLEMELSSRAWLSGKVA